MTFPLQIAFHGLDPTDALRDAVNRSAADLDRFADRITGCQVIIEAVDRHNGHAGHFAVRVHLAVPGHEFEAGRLPKGHAGHEDAYAAIRETFENLYRQVSEFEDRRRAAKRAPTPAL